MTADRLTRAVRQQVGLGRFLALGGPRDGGWIAERAAEVVLRRAVTRDAPGVRLDGVRIGLAGPEAVGRAGEPAVSVLPAVPAPPGALPPEPLRVTAEFSATAARPLPETAERVRAVLAEGAVERIGLDVVEVDLRVAELLEVEPAPSAEGGGEAGPGTPESGEGGVGGDAEVERVGVAALAVPGVSRLTGVLGRSVQVSERASVGALPRRHVRVDLAVAGGVRPLDVVRGVRVAVGAVLPDGPTVAVLVTAVD
ncbi:nucleopolyhedrovirus P10 family protein [Streptomyces fungicidicus]|uniref:nucleopolyhedrovirus P10 family protein n=1 Tax=Streptomyces fungicidicus TaxID=68203 RepID=UPI0033335230